MKVAVLLPCHIYYDNQLEMLDKCLQSLCVQSKPTDIYVSISFASEIYRTQFSTVLRKYENVRFKLSQKQKYQMEHIANLLYEIKDYDMIMFCDDDDSYHPNRVEVFANVFELTKTHCIENDRWFGGVYETSTTKYREAVEYWAYGVPPSFLIEFYDRLKGYEDLLCNLFADMYLRNFLARTRPNTILFGAIPDKLYNYNINNPNSICGHIQRQRGKTPSMNDLKHNLLLFTIDQDELRVKYLLKKLHIPFSSLSHILPCVMRVKALTYILYK